MQHFSRFAIGAAKAVYWLAGSVSLWLRGGWRYYRIGTSLAEKRGKIYFQTFSVPIHRWLLMNSNLRIWDGRTINQIKGIFDFCQGKMIMEKTWVSHRLFSRSDYWRKTSVHKLWQRALRVGYNQKWLRKREKTF